MRLHKKIEYPGKLITFEGIDRAGKSSVVSRLRDDLRDSKKPVVCCGEFQSPIGPVVLELLLNNKTSPFSKTFLFAADRSIIYEEICLPALKRGELVLWDRYVDTAVVYCTRLNKMAV